MEWMFNENRCIESHSYFTSERKKLLSVLSTFIARFLRNFSLETCNTILLIFCGLHENRPTEGLTLRTGVSEVTFTRVP